MDQSCFSLKHLSKFQKSPFVYVRKTETDQQILTYDAIIEDVTKCVNSLGQFNVENNVGIAVNLQNHSASSCILLLGILNHNCHFYCVDVAATKDVENYLRLSGVKYIISKDILKLELISYTNQYELKILDEVFYLGTLETCNESFQNVRLCYTIATSGSTGIPKMVHATYESIEPNIKSLSSLLKIQEDDIIFLGSPPTFDPFVVELFLALENGAALLITCPEVRLKSDYLLKILFPSNLNFKGLTVLQTTPSLLRFFGQENIHDVILNTKKSLRCLILGGEEFPSWSELKTWLPFEFSSSGKRIFNIYGITEVSCWTSIYEFLLVKDAEYNRMSLGKSLDDSTFLRIIDKDDNFLLNNCCKGELLIGSSKRRCFIPQCDKDINVLKSLDVIYRKTGDIVERDDFGNIYYVGRKNNTIKRFGKRLCLDSLGKKIENLFTINNVQHKVVCLWHTETTKLILYVIIDKTIATVKSAILDILKENLEKHEEPDEIFYNKDLPINNNGKVDRKKILEKILSIRKNQRKAPLEIFKSFLEKVIGFNNELNEDANSRKRLKHDLHISFSQAGGTSFQALSLATEIADSMENPEEQRKILELLLDNKVAIKDILEFLSSTTKNKLPINATKVCDKTAKDTMYTFKLLWQSDLKRCIDASPIIYQENVLAVGSHSHLLLTLNTDTGSELSRIELPDRIECSVVFVSGDIALVGCYDGFLYGFNYHKGSIKWKINVKGMIKAKPLVIDNMVIVGSYAEEFNVMAFDMKSLDCLWKLKLGERGIFSSPLQISDKSVLLCCLDGSYALLKASTGSANWFQKLDSPIFSTPAKFQSSDMLLVLAEVKGQILICKAETGEKRTSFQTEGNIFSGLTLHQHDTNNTKIIFGCHDKNVYCLNFERSTNGLTLFWKFLSNAPIYSTPILLSKRYILSCSTKGLIMLIDLETSNLRASYNLEAEIFSTPCSLRDQIIYVGARDNFLYALKLE